MKCNGCARLVRGLMVPMLAASGLLAGCQSYTARPLELEEFAATLERRLLETGRIAEFASSLYEEEGATHSFDLGDGIDFAEAEVLALFYNPSLRAVRAAAGHTKADAENAGLWQDPEFGFDAAQVLSPGSQFEFGGMLGLTLPISGRLGIERDRADAEHEVALLRIADAEWNIRMDVRKAWANLMLARGRVEQYEQFAEQSDSLMATIDQLVGVGELGRIEGRLVRIERAVRLAERSEVELAAFEARGLILGMIGLPADSAVEFQNGLRLARPVVYEDIQGRLLESNTSLAVVVVEYEVTEHTLRHEVRKQYPDISIGGGFGSEDDDKRLLFGITLPIPILNANRAGIAHAYAAREAAGLDAELMLDQIIRELFIAKVRAEAVRIQRELYVEDIAPMLDVQSQEIRELASLGEIRTLVLLETLTKQMETKRRLLELIAEQAISDTEVTRLLGPDTERRGPIMIEDAAKTAGGAE